MTSNNNNHNHNNASLRTKPAWTMLVAAMIFLSVRNLGVQGLVARTTSSLALSSSSSLSSPRTIRTLAPHSVAYYYGTASSASASASQSVSQSRCMCVSVFSTTTSSLGMVASSSAAATSTASGSGSATSKGSGSKAKAKTGLPKILLKRNRQTKNFRDGSQLVFSGSIAKEPKSLKVGDLVQIEVPSEKKKNGDANHSGNNNYGDAENVPTTVVGWGLYNPGSLYRVRIVLHGLLNPHMAGEVSDLVVEHGIGAAESLILGRILDQNLNRALSTRIALGLPSDETDTYRLVNGEGDGLSGLAVDVVGGNVAVVMSSAAWCEIHRETILESLQEILPDHELIWKTTPSRLKQDGYEADETRESNEDDHDNDSDKINKPVVCRENGIRYQTFPRQKGQKTSVYCDQRENRFHMAELCSGKRVLDLCCYHGGFSLNAVQQGAARAIGVDSSADAIETCRTNARLNGFGTDDDDENANDDANDDDASSTLRYVRSDIADYMRNCDETFDVDANDDDASSTLRYVRSDIADYMRNCDETFDVVVLDPPKLAPSVKALQRASRKYHSLNRDAIKLIDPMKGGLLMTCTCSAAMTQKDGGKFFLETVQQASLSARREVTLLRVSGAAPCHTQSPFSFPAGNYLTAALFVVHPVGGGGGSN
eukprot:CAMPEP_0172377340 /NCGR_PEP_ID=MMETSP1060-20121228/68855_1 /TAXON_ID=37318 /ORGANISM="Pseudo-nitzschia pungens, Strain cf. cingulata" /LENGTH=653 /DNA_ID=CAMNT_0013105023 /DNA_START=632 /DNA_END=2593 /DNA_ORIENTATION=+